jgi:hypothetical protein
MTSMNATKSLDYTICWQQNLLYRIMMECINTLEYLEYPKKCYTDHCAMMIPFDLSSFGKVSIEVPKKRMTKIISSDINNVTAATSTILPL